MSSIERDEPPRNANILAKWLDEAATASGIAAGRLRRQLGFIVLAAILDQERDAVNDSPIFLVKGGVAMEFRTGGSARATRDFDSALRVDISDLTAHLDAALRTGFGDFSAVRTSIEPVRDTGALRCEIKISYRNKPVITVPFEIAPTEGAMSDDIDHVPALSLSHLGLDGPPTVACVAVRWQIAQKLHACTERPAERENDRFRDLIDLQILRDLVPESDWHEVRVACVAVFEHRAKHAWPPELTLPESWTDGYRTLATDSAFKISDVETAAAAVRHLIARIESAQAQQ